MKEQVWYLPKINALLCHWSAQDRMGICANAKDSLKIPFKKLKKIGPKKMGYVFIGEL